MSPSLYRKALVSLAGAVATWGAATYPEDPRWGLLVAVVGSVAVYIVPNEDAPEDAG